MQAGKIPRQKSTSCEIDPHVYAPAAYQISLLEPRVQICAARITAAAFSGATGCGRVTVTNLP